MADTRLYIQSQKHTLKTSIALADTTIELNSFNLPDGTAIASGDLGSINYATIASGTANEESISFTGLSGTSLTGVTRGLRFDAPYTQDTTLRKAHAAGTVLLLSNTASFYDNFVNKGNDETMTGSLTVTAPTADLHVATKKYVDDTTNGGAVSHDTEIIAGTAGATVAAGDIVYFDATAKEWLLADASAAATSEQVILGIAQGAGTDGNPISGGVLLSGLDKNQTGMTAGTKQFLSDTAGGISESAGTVEVTLGFSNSGSTTDLIFDPRNDQQITEDIQDALAGDGGTPSATNLYQTQRSSRFGIRTMTAGATINGATLPVPVYQNKTDNEFYACDGNDTAALKFVGFAVSNGTDGASIDIQYNGIVTGFSGLDEGEKYYLSDTVGTIQNSPGTKEVLVGVAISTTELLIQKGRRYDSGTTSFSATGTTTVTVGFRVSKVTIFANNDLAAADQGMSQGAWTVAGGNACVYLGVDGTDSGKTTTAWRTPSSSSARHTGVVDTITDTTFRLNNTKTSGPADVEIMWIAEGEL